MKVLVVGSSGNMGKRYCSIIRYLKHDLLEYDPAITTSRMPSPLDYDVAIIATPISEHVPYIRRMVENGKPVLCEKPLEKRIEEVKKLAKFVKMHNGKAYMVNNWAFVGEHREPMSAKNVVVNCYNTGNDGIWDLVQPLYLVEDIENFECTHSYPWLSVRIDDCGYGRDDFDRSYVDMVEAFCNGEYEKLWAVEDMVTAHERVVEYGQRI